MKVLDLFSGIGSFSLGLERGGMTTVAFCEREPYCKSILRKHWPEVPIYDDVKTLTVGRLASDGISVDVICGGWPCQDISYAGKGAGLKGERSGLWSEYARLIGEFRPRYAIMENVSALLGRGLDCVLGDLASLGYNAEWHCIPAYAVGAPHERDRIWIIAYPNSLNGRAGACEGGERRKDGPKTDHRSQPASDAALLLRPAFFWKQSQRAVRSYWPQTWEERLEELRGMDDGVASRMDGLAAIGNTLLPQIPEIISRAIMNT
jgi:DNA (cytosine-5)-methyltransferase 1